MKITSTLQESNLARKNMINPLKQNFLVTLNDKWLIQAWYVPILAISMGLMMLRPLVMARLFNTEEFAVYSAGLLISSTFCMLGCLGIQPMLQRKMPMHLMSGKEFASIVLLIQGAFIAIVTALSFSSLGFSGLSITGMNSEGFAISMFHGLSQQLFVLATIESRSRGEPLRFSFQYLIRAGLVATGASIVAFYTLSPLITLFVEALLSIGVAYLIMVRVVSRNSTSVIYLIISAVRTMRKIRWREAFALMAVMVIGFTLVNIDRWLAATWLSAQQFAWYAFAWILLAISQSAHSIINSSVYPSLARRYVLKGRPSSFMLAAKVSFSLLIVAILFILPAYYFMKVLILNWFSDYFVSIKLIPIFLALALVRLTDFWSSYLVIIGKERLLLTINVAVGSIVFIVWLSVVTIQSTSSDDKMLFRLAWMALGLTIINYLFVFFAALKFRK